jgi:hypothetical protein
MLCFIHMLPPYFASGAGAEMRRSVGTAMLWGAFGVTLFRHRPDAGVPLRHSPLRRATSIHGRPLMNGEDSAKRDALLEALAAELTLVAYRVALRARAQGTWLDLELGLWRALTEKVKTWGQENGLGPANR